MLRGFGRSCSSYGVGRCAIEHVIGAEVNELGTCGRAVHGQALHCPRVDPECLILLVLAHLYVVKGGAVEHDCRMNRREGRPDRGVVGDVELAAGKGHDLMTVPEPAVEVGGQLASSAGDEASPSAHSAARKWSICGVNSWSSSSQRML